MRVNSQVYKLDNKIMHNKSFTLSYLLSSTNRMGRPNSLKCMLFLILVLLFVNIQSIVPSQPIIVSPNTESSPSNFIFNFILEKQLESTGYLMVIFTPLSTQTLPKTCDLINSNSSLYVTTCQNLNKGSNDNTLTINTTWINQINPNIASASIRTIVVQFNQNLLAGVEYSIQILTQNVLPAIGSITSNMEMYTISGTGFMLEENWNFGQVYFEYRQNNILNVNSINDLTQNFPGTLTSNLEFEITIGVNCPTPSSIIKFIISGDFQFSASSLVNVQGVLSTAPQVLSTKIVSKNIIVTKFGESFVAGRKFKISITDISNPLKITSGFVSVYYLPDNSMSPLEIKELAIPIATKKYVPTVEIQTGEGITAVSPIQFYSTKLQYITVIITLPRQLDPNFVIQISSDKLEIQQSTVYAKASTVQASKLNYNHYDANRLGVRISGFPTTAAGSKITATMKVWIPDVQSFNVYVSIDKESAIANPIIQGNAPAVDTVVPLDFAYDMKGNEQNSKLSSMTGATGTPYSLIQFMVNPSFPTEVGSSLRIYTCQNLIKAQSWNDMGSCIVATIVRPCTITTNDSITLITINSGSSNNLFVMGTAVLVVIKDLQFKYVSSHTEFIYQFYFQMTLSLSATNVVVKKTVHVLQVIPQRPNGAVTGFMIYFSNDLLNAGTNYPNIIRIVSDDPNKWTYIVQATERRMITIFHKQEWRKLFTTLNSGDAYPFLTNLDGVTSNFIKGATTNITDDCPLTWDQIHFILPGTENVSKFSLAIPTTYYGSATGEYQYELMSGIYNTETRTITYRAIEEQPIATKRTYLAPAAVSISVKPKQTSTKILLSGQAGSYKNSIELKVVPALTNTFTGNSYSSSLIILSSWNWFDSTTTYNSQSFSNTVGYPTFALEHQKPMSLQIGKDQYLTLIPFIKNVQNPLTFSVYFDNVKLPYTSDLPYYSILLIDYLGAIDSYNEFINQDQGVFYQTIFKKMTFSCSDNSLGVKNTDCSIGFITNHQIEIGSKIYVALTGLTVSTNKCELVRLSDGFVAPNSCLSNTDKSEVVITLKNTERLPANTEYILKIYGLEILQNTITHYALMSIRDPSGGYYIESGSRILLTSVSSYFPIYIQQMTYLKNNPIVVSGFSIIFTLPRLLNRDEIFTIVMSNDLSNLNNVPCKLKIRLYFHANNTEIPNVRWFLNTKNYQIQFQGLYQYLDAFKYRLEIYGLKTPSTISQKIISLIYLRTFDNTYTVQNTDDSTAVYPSLVDKVNSLITLKPYFNTEGIEQPLQFNITGQYAKVTADTVWYITLPRYYSQKIWNQDFLIYCTINYTKLDCGRHQNIPYTIMIKNSPRVIDVGEWYVIHVYGITCPRKLYLVANPTYVTESIFFGIAMNQTADSYVQYSELFITDPVYNPQDGGYGTITAKQVTSSNSQTFQTTYFTVKLTCTVPINAGNWIYIQFPQGFDNFKDLPMEGQIKVGTLAKTFTATSVNTNIGFKVPLGVIIAANIDFIIEISSLPTPKQQLTIDMNKMIIVLTPADRVRTLASSLQLHNQVTSKSFTSNQLHLVINNYQSIQLTAGTYTNLVKIESSDKKTFMSNIKVQFISSSLKFEPNPLSLYIGDTAGYFRISAPQTIIPTTYTFEIIKSESSISAFYTALSKYSVSISNNPIQVAIPSSVNLPKGACSIPVKIFVARAPSSDLQINFEYDSDLYKLDEFWINEEISYTELEYTSNVVERQLSFCCSGSFKGTVIPVNIYMGGSNEQAYTLSRTNFTVNVVSNASTIALPSLSIAVVNTQKTYAKLSLTTNLAGILYYELKLSPLTSPLALLQLKYEIKQLNLTLQNQKDFLSKVYVNDRDHRINFATMATGVNFIQFENLLPDREYTFCAYFQNQHRNSTQRMCQNFTMQAWGSIKKAYIKFKYTIQENQLNTILCYFVKTSNAEINQIVSLEGKSCSLNTSASNYYFKYPGQLKTNELSSTIIYHVSDQNLTTDPSSSAFSSMYDANGITVGALATALANFSISYISNSNSEGLFTPMDAIKTATENFKPTLTFSQESYQRGSTSLYLRNLKLSKPGSIYLILTPYKKLSKNQIAGHTDIEIRPLITPTYEQILNCKDGYDVGALSCQRIVLKDGETMDVELSGITDNRMYALFYVVACEYPLRPVIYGDVQKLQMVTVLLYDATITVGVGLLFMVFMVLFF